MPDQATFSTTHNVKNNEASTHLLKDMTRKWLRTNDRNLEVKADLAFHPFSSFPLLEVAVGGMYRHKNRENYYNEYTLLAQVVNNEHQEYTHIENALYDFKNPLDGRGSIVSPNSYDSQEDIMAYYGQLRYNHPKYEIIIGVRNEMTKSRYSTAMPEHAEGKYGSNSYSDLLPSVNLKYIINKTRHIRLSYYRSICRPGFFEVIPYNIEGEYFNEWGNPYIKHTVADNIDLRYEIFPTGVDQILFGFFYKNLTNPIEYVVEKAGTINNLVLMPRNFDNAVNYGAELVTTKYFRNIGISFNYTFTQSSITTNKLYYQPDYTNKEVKETRPLQGQSKHIGNASLLYRNQKAGMNAQISGVFTGRRISSLSAYEGMDYWQGDYIQMDFSAEKTIFHNAVVYVKINNLLSTPLLEFVNKPNTQGNFVPMQTERHRMLVRKEIYRPTYQIGLRIII